MCIYTLRDINQGVPLLDLVIHHAIMDGRLLHVSDLVFIYLNNTFVSMTKLFAITGNIVYYIYIYTAGPRLSESPLSEPSVIRTLFRILKCQKTV